jgi:hypothetical protein
MCGENMYRDASFVSPLSRPRTIQVATAIVLLLAILASSAAAQTSGSPQPPAQSAPARIADAQARLRANDPAGATKILEALVTAAPEDAIAWRLLGNTRQQLKDYDGAIAAYQRLLELKANLAPQALYGLGAVYALKGNADRAIEWLTKARDSRQVDMTQMDTDSALASIRRDPRYGRLRPQQADFEKPFVEAVTIFREWRGESANDQFGWVARKLGDVDADGISDFVTSAPTSAAGGANSGRIYVYSSGTGSLRWSANGRPGDRLGIGAEAAGDINRDGVTDVIAGAPGGGYASVYSGVDGKILLTVKAEDPSDAFGRQATGAGDVDQDGFADFVVGAPNNDAGGNNAGRAYLYSGKDGRVLLTLTGERAGDNFGSAVGANQAGQFNLILVGAPGAGPAQRGRTYAFKSLTEKPAFIIDADATGAAMGAMFVTVVGDVDRDGIPDAFSSDFANAAKGASTGRTVIHSGKDGRLLFALTGETAGEGFGTSNSLAGDVDGDGHADLIVGAWQYAGEAAGAGRTYLYSGRDGQLLKTYTSKVIGEAFGFDSVDLGDVDGDGMIDFLITAAWSGVNGFHSGRVFIVSSGVRSQSRSGLACNSSHSDHAWSSAS